LNPCPSVLETDILPLNYFPKMMRYIIEIKYRVVCVLIASFASILTSIKYRYYIIYLLLDTYPKLKESSTKYFILTSVTELFDVFLNTWLFITSYVLYYFMYYHIVSFMSLGLYRKEYENLKKLFVFSLFLWLVSTNLFLRILLPLTYEFFFEFRKESDCKNFKLYLEPKLDTYIDFTLNIYLQSYVTFQLFSVFVFLFEYAKTKEFVAKFKKIIYIKTLIIATIITPPDIWSQITLYAFLIISIETYLLIDIFGNNLKWRIRSKE
jgi:sec-independent protein translocase protein TatC